MKNFESKNKTQDQEIAVKPELNPRQIRKAKEIFMRTFLNDAADLAFEKEKISRTEKNKELLVPPIDKDHKLQHFYLKQAWDNFSQPILDYENLKKDIEESQISNIKKKEAVRELEVESRAAEDRLVTLPDWDSNATDEVKRKYLLQLEKFLP